MFISFLHYALIGAISGTIAGLLGIAGGIVIIPCLVFIFSKQASIPADVMMHFVVGTSLASIIATTLFSLRAQYRRGAIDFSLFKQLAPGVLMGTVLGAILSSFLQTNILKMLFGLFMLSLAIQMFFGLGNSGTRQLQPASRWTGSLFIGTASGLLGLGGGALMTPWLNYFNVPIRQAIATSTACGSVIAFTGTMSYILTGFHYPNPPEWSTGYVYWPAAIAIALFSPLFANLGVAISYRLPIPTLKNIFAMFVFVIGLNMLFFR